MNMPSHEEQKEAWEREHDSPSALLQMDSSDVSGGVKKFFEFLLGKGLKNISGLEMGCGKGRNVIWLAEQKEIREVSGFDFSENAIREAISRASKSGISDKVNFTVADATSSWPYGNETFDFVIDCFAASDIEDRAGREFAAKEAVRVLKPGGFILVYELSTDDEYHKMMLSRSPAEENGSFINPDGKFEKVFTQQELYTMYASLKPIFTERINKETEFYGEKYKCHHFWIVFQKQVQ